MAGQSNYMYGYYWNYATREEANNWPIAPGNMLVFMDPDGKHFYVKTLGWRPNEQVVFREFSEDLPVVNTPNANGNEAKSICVIDEIKEIKTQISELFELVKRENNKWQNKKGDNK